MGYSCKLFIGLEINPTKGEWFDVSDENDIDTAFETIQALADADAESGGEIGIMDCEPSFLSKVSRSQLGDVVEALAESHHSDDLLCALWGISDDANEFLQVLSGDSRGVYGPYRRNGDFAEEQNEGADWLTNIPDEYQRYIDFEAMEHDWIASGDYAVINVIGEGRYFVSSN